MGAAAAPKAFAMAKKIATDDMGVEFIDVDVNAFKQKVLPLHEKMLNENPKIRDLYEHIQEANEAAAGKTPIPKIRSGSNKKLTTTPAIWNHIGAIMFPVACIIFWIAICTMLGNCVGVL